MVELSRDHKGVLFAILPTPIIVGIGLGGPLGI